MRQINNIVIHCSATKRSQNVNAAVIRDWHKSKTPPWSDIGYHFVIVKGGSLEIGRSLERPGAHVRGHNQDSIAICLEGGLDENGKPENNFDEDQFNTLKSLVNGFVFKYPNAKVKGHRDFSPDKNHDGIITKDEWLKVCPCFDVGEWYESTKVEQNKNRESKMEESQKNGMDQLHNSVNSNSSNSKKSSNIGRGSRSKRSGSDSSTN